MNGFERRTEKKKESIRRAAVDLFRVHGFDKVSMNDIAKQAGVSHVTIYNHFHSKEELILDVIKGISRDITDYAHQIIDGDLPFFEKINKLMFNKATLLDQYQGELLRVISRDYPEFKRYVNELREKEINALLDKLIAEGKKTGHIDEDISARAISYYFEILRNGIYADKELLEKIEVNGKLAKEIMRLTMFGLISKKK